VPSFGRFQEWSATKWVSLGSDAGGIMASEIRQTLYLIGLFVAVDGAVLGLGLLTGSLLG
jgi:hypothetical protein